MIEQLIEDRAQARARGQISAAIRATELIARICGFFVHREETGVPGEFANLKSAEEVLDVIREKYGDRAAQAISDAADAMDERKGH